jgi:hypothetical protein
VTSEESNGVEQRRYLLLVGRAGARAMNDEMRRINAMHIIRDLIISEVYINNMYL